MATTLELEEEHQVVEKQMEQQQLFMDQQKETLGMKTPVVGRVQIVGQIQIQERFKLAIITTDRFRKNHEAKFSQFLKDELRWVIAKKQNINPEVALRDDSYFENDDCLEFDIWATGNTCDFIFEHYRKFAAEGIISRAELVAIERRVRQLPTKTRGLVHITFELVEGRMGSIFHFCDYKDSSGSPSVGVLRRQALVHDVLYSDTVQGAESICRSWKNQFSMKPGTLLVRTLRNQVRAGHVVNIEQLRKDSSNSLHRGGGLASYNNNVALIAHDGKKLDLCCFVLEHLDKILKFDRILCTGTTGMWLKRFIGASLKLSNQEVNLDRKMILCESGPKGGDVQIAHAAINGLCSRVIFFIDPMQSHPHEVDIRFFEEAVESSVDYPVYVATNEESAHYLLSSVSN